MPDEDAYVVPDNLTNEPDDLVFEDQEPDTQPDPAAEDIETAAPVLSVSSLSDEDLAAEFNRRASLYNPQPQAAAPAAEPTPGTDPRLARVAELQEQAVETSYTDPTKAEQIRSQAHKLELQIETEAIEKRLTAQFEQRFNQVAAQVVPITTERAIASVTSDPLQQEYLRTESVALSKQGISLTALLEHPATSGVYLRAAKQYASEKTPARVPMGINASSETRELTAEDERAVRDFERETGTKVTKDVLKMAVTSNGYYGGKS